LVGCRHRDGRGLDKDGPGGGRREAGAVGGDVVDGVGGHCARVEHDVANRRAVEEGLDAEVEVGLRAGDRGAQVGVGAAGAWLRGGRGVPMMWLTDGDPSHQGPSQALLGVEPVQQLFEGFLTCPAGHRHGLKIDRRVHYRACSPAR
jgi:hypothetical protein